MSQIQNIHRFSHSPKRRQRIRHATIVVSFILFPLTIFYFSPALVFLGVRLGVVNGSLLLFGALFVSATFFGRLFCAWICPGAGLGEICFSINQKQAVGGKYDRIKWFLWIPWIIAIALVTIIVGKGFHSIDPFLATWYGISIHNPRLYIAYFGVVGLIYGLSIKFGKRAFCHYVCWMAPFMILGQRLGQALGIPELYIFSVSNKCTQCGQCETLCPMSLPVSSMAKKNEFWKNSECIRCGTCLDTCPNKAITFRFIKHLGMTSRAPNT